MALKNIMLVEDEPDIREITSLALEELGGFKLTVCSTGQQAIDKFESVCPQLILLDVMMPQMDGPMTLAKLKKLPGGEKTPVIFITAKVQTHEIKEYQKLGAIGVIPKPFDPITLSSDIQALWSKYINERG